MSASLRFGTRGSALALWQTNHVIDLLRAARPDLRIETEIIKTRGDQVMDIPLPLIGSKGAFTAELESALHRKQIDCAVHSLKDLPTEQPEGLVIGAVPERANPADVLISRRGYTLETLLHGARVGTSSRRRSAQLLYRRPDFNMADIRGNVDTRIHKALHQDSEYDAIVLAYAGVERLGQLDVISQVLPFEDMLPAPGQGAIAVQTRDDAHLLETLQSVHHADTALAVTAERAFLAALGSGCSLPVAAYGYWLNDRLVLRGRVSALDGSRQIEVSSASTIADTEAAYEAGAALARLALSEGAQSLMEQTT